MIVMEKLQNGDLNKEVFSPTTEAEAIRKQHIKAM
jgi:hypothetical protein